MNLASGISVPWGQRYWRVSGNKPFGWHCIYQWGLAIFQTLTQSLRIMTQSLRITYGAGLELSWALHSSHHLELLWLSRTPGWAGSFGGRMEYPNDYRNNWFTPAQKDTPWFFFFLFTLTHIPRSLGSEYHQAANLPYHLSSSSLSYNCFFYWSHMCWEIYMWISFPSILPRKVGIFLSLSLLFPRGNLWLERLCNFPGHLTSEWEDQTLDLCPSDSIIGTSNHSPKLCLWMTRSQSAGVSWG